MVSPVAANALKKREFEFSCTMKKKKKRKGVSCYEHPSYY